MSVILQTYKATVEQSSSTYALNNQNFIQFMKQ